jgi:hypothetical protein
MVTMIDEFFDRSYRDGRAELNASLASGLSNVTNAVMNAFDVLNRIEYQAPWTARAKRAR